MVGSLASRRMVDRSTWSDVHRVQRVLVVGAQRVDHAGQHRHRVRVAREAVEEPLEVLVQHGVPLDPVGEIRQLFGRRQLAVDQQVADLDEGRLLGELVDRVTAVAQNAGVAVDVGDGTLAGGGVDEAVVECGVVRSWLTDCQAQYRHFLRWRGRSAGRSRPLGTSERRCRRCRPREPLCALADMASPHCVRHR